MPGEFIKFLVLLPHQTLTPHPSSLKVSVVFLVMRNFCKDPISNWWCDYRAPPPSLCLKETASDLSSSHTHGSEGNFGLSNKSRRNVEMTISRVLKHSGPPLSHSRTWWCLLVCVCTLHPHQHPHTPTPSLSLSPPPSPGHICIPGLYWCNRWVTQGPHRVFLAAKTL